MPNILSNPTLVFDCWITFCLIDSVALVGATFFSFAANGVLCRMIKTDKDLDEIVSYKATRAALRQALRIIRKKVAEVEADRLLEKQVLLILAFVFLSGIIYATCSVWQSNKYENAFELYRSSVMKSLLENGIRQENFSNKKMGTVWVILHVKVDNVGQLESVTVTGRKGGRAAEDLVESFKRHYSPIAPGDVLTKSGDVVIDFAIAPSSMDE